MGRYSYVDASFLSKQAGLGKVVRTSLQERRRRLRIEIDHLLQVLDRKLQAERLSLMTLEVKRMTITAQKPNHCHIETMLQGMGIAD